ncbi:hypothetical protein HHK36_030186 [Tetracentron sinense]|uniref:Uncharacterized protein n=1 Tax=Tetracentron sinense TaxID=13715 RepID=A0A835D0A9_TETSI|nr:hypothetical protein HHK36_030186 [Tetracentron sinense]
MAEAVVTFFLQKLIDLVAQEADFLVGVEEQLQLLRIDLQWIHSFLKDADGRSKENERVKLWVSQVRDVTYDAEDVIDTFLIKIESHQRKKIEEINKRIERIKHNKSSYGIEDIRVEISGSSNEGPSRGEKLAPIVEEVDVVGFEDDVKTLTRKLIGEETKGRTVISIVGMGGLGKTIVAKKIYNSSDIERHFDYHAWVVVSQNYQIRKLLLDIIKCVMVPERKKSERKKFEGKFERKDFERKELERTESERKEFEILESMGEEALGMKLSEHLNQRRYLVVIDDIWCIEAWEGLESAFPKGKPGSRVLITTRNKEVALFTDIQSPPHELSLLREDKCWELFCKKAFRDVNYSCPTDLEILGKKFVEKCGGLPLAVVAMGGFLLRKARSSTEWEKVLKTIRLHLNEGQSQISRILALSYDGLPYYMKSCFLYFGIFPEDIEIRKKRLIQLWVAEGFIQERRGETLEEVAEEYLQELIDRSLIQLAKKSSGGGVKACCIHDLLRELSILEAREDKFLQVDGNIEDSASPSSSRRFVIHQNINRRYVPLDLLASNLCSLSWLTKMSKEELKVIFSHGSFKLPRVLDIGVTISRLPKEVGDLIHLRYLGIYCIENETLPSSIGNLRNLQTINMGKCNIHAPNSFWKLQQLRNVRVGAGKIGVVGCPQMDRLKNLQTLNMVTVGRWIEHGLSQLTNLRKLGMHGTLSLHEEVLSRSIVKLEHLHSLKLIGAGKTQSKRLFSFKPFNLIEDDTMLTFAFFEHLGHLHTLYLLGRLKELPRLHEFPPNLTKLTLKYSFLEQDPMEWTVMEGAMPSLKCLSIRDCDSLKMLPEGLLQVTTREE